MKILIVEDNVETAEALSECLRSESFAVDTTKDGEQGSYMARVNEYDLILIDLSLPKKNGLTIIRELREKQKQTYIIVISAHSSTDEKVLAFKYGADDYITKPFSYDELKARIQAVLRRPSKLEADILTIDNLALDRNKKKAQRGKQIIYLTRKEFSLLEYLMLNQGNVVSRSMIMEHVWNSESDPFSNTIEAHILNLRKKIEPQRSRKLIHNVPGRGYKIDTEK